MGLVLRNRGRVRYFVSFALIQLICALHAGCHRSSRDALPLAINEISASATHPSVVPGGGPIVDAQGLPADWVEIYNPLPAAVNLAGYTLSDDPQDPEKFRFPSLVLQPGGFVVVILDGDETAGPLHAGFGLRNEGETIRLYGGNGRVEVDRRVYVTLETDATAGRHPDGGEDYGVIYAPTPGARNKPIGIRPPRFKDQPQVSPEGTPEDPELVPLTFKIIEDAGVETERTWVQRALTENCSGPFVRDPDRPGRTSAEEIHRASAPDEMRLDVFGRPRAVPQEEVTYATLIPSEPEGTLLRLRITAVNRIGRTVQLGCHCFGCQLPTVVINEFQPRNQGTIRFDRYNQSGTLSEENRSYDWLEIYNYGEEAVDIGGLGLVGKNTWDELNSPLPGAPPPFVWRFEHVGLNTLGPKEFLLLVADNDFPFVRKPDGTPDETKPSYRFYARHGESDRKYRSSSFQIAAGEPDSFFLLAADDLLINKADFDFSDQPGGEIAPDASFGRYPDADAPQSHLEHINGVESGRLLDCPTPEAPNLIACEVVPTFDEVVFTEPRCPGPASQAVITAFLSIDQDTAASDTPESPRFEVELRWTAGGEPRPPLKRGQGLEVRPPTQAEVDRYGPSGTAGGDLYIVIGRLPGQPAGTLVVYELFARDVMLGASVTHDETQAPEVSFRYLAGYQRPPVVINEVFPGSNPLGAPLHYRGREGELIPQIDYLELFNNSSSVVDLSGMFLHDEGQPAPADPQGSLREFRIPDGTEIGPHGFLCLFFPRAGEEELVPADGIAVPSGDMGLDDCKEVVFLLSRDEEGNCVVAEALWDVEQPPTPPATDPICPAELPVGRFPDGALTLRPQNFDQLAEPTPCWSNCGERQPTFSIPPLHFPLTSREPSTCVESNEIVLIEAAVLIDAFAAILVPGPIPSSPTGISEATLLVRRGDTVTEERLSTSSLSNPPPPDKCYVQVKLSGQIRPPHPAATFYRIRVLDGNGNQLLSEELSFGTAGEEPRVAINEVMARNTSTIADEEGLFSPWLEILNHGTATVDVGGMFLTDQRAQPRRWQVPRIPQAVLPPLGCLVVFLDGETEDADDLHASFTIPSTGPGELFLLDRPEGGTCIIDAFAFDFTGRPPDTSLGRLPDGTGEPAVLPAPSPCGVNSGGRFIRAEVTGNERVNLTDLAWFFQILFHERDPQPSCQKALDVDDNGVIDVNDGLYLGDYLFLDGPAIPAPFPDPGTDPTPDDLPCL